MTDLNTFDELKTLDNVVGGGLIIAVDGPSGTGKSTVCRLLATAADNAGGKLTPRDGASLLDGDRVAWSLDKAASGDGVVTYRGTVHATAKFSLADVVVKDPWVRTKADGTRVLSAEISDGYNSSDDSVTRRELGTLVERDGRTVLTQGPVELNGVTVAQ